MRACVYTEIFGAYDPLREQPQQSIPTDFLCFTDSDNLVAPTPWTAIVNKDRAVLSPRMRAKYFKVLSHRIFPGGFLSGELTSLHDVTFRADPYDYLIHIDASVQVVSPDFVKMVIAHMTDHAWTMVAHPDRDCIYAEVTESLKEWPKKYSQTGILKQIEEYRAEGYPEHNGLFAATVIGRKANVLQLNNINELWWREMFHYDSPQDQISLPVVLRRTNGCPIAPITLYLYTNEYFKWVRHSRDD